MKSLGPFLIAFLVLSASVVAGVAAPSGQTDSVSPATASPSDPKSYPQSTSLDTTPLAEQANQTNVLRVSEAKLEVTRVETISMSVGHAVASDGTSLQGEYTRSQFENRFSEAETDSARRAIIQEAVAKLETRVTAVHRRGRTARMQFNSGGDGRNYIRTLGYLHAQANVLDQYALQIQRRADEVPNTSVSADIARLRGSVERFRGPVRSHLLDMMSGEAPPSRVYIATGKEDIVLATVTDDTYLREAYRGSVRQRAGPQSITSISEASRQIEAAYPWAWANQESLAARVIPATGKYEFGLVTPQGSLQASLDARTEAIYYETQEQRLSTQYLESTETANDDIRLRISRTYGGGPLRVQAVDPQTETPIDATVIINEEAVGSTGTDGRLWTVAPHTLNSIRLVAPEGEAEIVVS